MAKHKFDGAVQFAALPWRIAVGGTRQIMLLTSRDTRRWVIPKGWPMKGRKRWLGESEQSDKWVPCLIAALLPRSRRDHVETFATQPQPYIQGEGGLGCDQGGEDAGGAGT